MQNYQGTINRMSEVRGKMSYPWSDEKHHYCVKIFDLYQDIKYSLSDKAREIRNDACNVPGPDSPECKYSEQLVNAFSEVAVRIRNHWRQDCDPKGEWHTFERDEE